MEADHTPKTQNTNTHRSEERYLNPRRNQGYKAEIIVSNPLKALVDKQRP
jgi:hypothetical protein